MERYSVPLMLEGISQFHSLTEVMAKHYQPQDVSGFMQGFRRQDMTRIRADMAGDYAAFAQSGLIGADGATMNYFRAAQRLRMAAVATVFGSRDEIDMDSVTRTCSLMYEESQAEPATDMDKHAAEAYAAALKEEGYDGRRIAAIGKDLTEEQRITAINRAAQTILLGHFAGLLMQVKDPAEVRRQYMQAFRAMAKADLPALRTRMRAVISGDADAVEMSAEDEATILEAAELTWEVLPEEDLQRRAEAIVGQARERGATATTIDVTRLAVLSDLRRSWGYDDSYYVYGSLGSRGVVRDESRETPDQYLLVVLQEKDGEGEVTAEHVVAESPVAGPNAMYVFRQDVSEGLNWREVLALPKSYARYYGARAVRHVAVDGETMQQSMARKASALLYCTKDEFPYISFAGSDMRLPRGVVPAPDSIY
jgi:hypothetical protein